jgi:hypothetical protein
VTEPPVIHLNGAALYPDPSGALVWPARETLIVADLHLEKGSSYHAPRSRQFLPPYDSAATLERLARVLARHRPATVICLGDSFHDRRAADRLGDPARAQLRAMTAARAWIWVAGNHDPEPPPDLGGEAYPEMTLGPLLFRHEAQAESRTAGEVSGHYHPKASVRIRGRRVSARCFASDGRRLVMPAFGAYTGGLSVLAPAIRRLFAERFTAHMIGRERVYPFAANALSG